MTHITETLRNLVNQADEIINKVDLHRLQLQIDTLENSIERGDEVYIADPPLFLKRLDSLKQ